MASGRQRRRTRTPLQAVAPYSLGPVLGLGPATAIDPHRAVLLIQDMRGPLVAPFDLSSPSAQISIAIRRIVLLADAARDAGVPVVYVDATGGPDRGSALLAQMWLPNPTRPGGAPSAGEAASAYGAIPKLAPARGDIQLSRSHHSAFTGTDLRHRVRAWRRDQLIVTGVYAHIGALATVTTAAIEDIEPFLVPDATADLDEQRHREALDQAVRVGASVRASHDILQDLKAEPGDEPSTTRAAR